MLLFITGCNRDKTPPTVSITEPAYDGANVQFGDVFFVEFEAIDDADDGGLWRVELRGADGITPKPPKLGSGRELQPAASSWPLRWMRALGPRDP